MMADDNDAGNGGEGKTFTEAEVKAMLEKETSGLKAKVDELLTESKTAKAKAKEEAEAAAKAAEAAAKKSGDVEALEKSWQEKFDKALAEANGKAEGLTALVSRLTAGNTAKSIAAELALKGSESVLEALIAPRLAADFTGDDVKVSVRDVTGKPSALTIDDLKKEIASNPAFKPLLAGTQGSGAGGAGANGGADQKTVTRSQWDQMGHADRAAHSKSGGKVVEG